MFFFLGHCYNRFTVDGIVQVWRQVFQYYLFWVCVKLRAVMMREYKTMGHDHLDEELEIMNEQDAPGKVLSGDTFKEAIREMELPRPVCLSEKARLGEAVDIMQRKKIGSVLINDTNGRLMGIITERDILMKVIGIIEHWREAPVTEIMTYDPLALQEGDMIAYVMNNMHVGGYRHVPIVNEDHRPIAIISIKDVMSFILDHFPEDVTNITGEPYRGTLTREGA